MSTKELKTFRHKKGITQKQFEEIINKVVSLLYEEGGEGVSRRGMYGVNKSKFKNALEHYLITGENVLNELDQLTWASWADEFSEEDTKIVRKAEKNETFWNARGLLGDEKFDEMIHLANQYENELLRRQSYKFRRLQASIFTSKQSIRKYVFSRDGRACKHCGTDKRLTLDHIIPVAKGGVDVFENLQVLCSSCNSKKSSHA
jgi:hypothetical protein